MSGVFLLFHRYGEEQGGAAHAGCAPQCHAAAVHCPGGGHAHCGVHRGGAVCAGRGMDLVGDAHGGHAGEPDKDAVLGPLVPFSVSIWPARSPEVIMWVMTKVQLRFVPWG